MVFLFTLFLVAIGRTEAPDYLCTSKQTDRKTIKRRKKERKEGRKGKRERKTSLGRHDECVE